jgi:hypothetical protein
MSDEQNTIKNQPPRLRLPLWAVALVIAFSSAGAAVGVFGTDAMKANFFIYFNVVAIPAVVIVFLRGWLRRRRNPSSDRPRGEQ